jgi:benzoyl-CoA-dihydrodiol lyase
LKLNSYDLGVDIELPTRCSACASSIPEVRAVVIRSGKDNVFCAGANIGALAKATHGDKVNFCKFTNETRLAIEDASRQFRPALPRRGQRRRGRRRLRAGGFACDWIT